MNDTVANSVDLTHIRNHTMLFIQQSGSYHLDSYTMVGDISLNFDLIFTLGLMSQLRIAQTDFLYQALSHNGLIVHIEELVFQRRRTAV